ncbi:MAG: dehypoxanthine futalosine cyclase [Deltaproteobacteria bacterium]|nr:dehypoxanthine futalosine cyclase [Deltaproteobacteria bacterium]
MPPTLEGIIKRVKDGHRVSMDQAAALYAQAEFLDLGALAHGRRLALHPDMRVTYVVDRNINYTNVCVSGCRFCAFYKAPGSPDGYVLSREELARKIQETIDVGGTQILLQGGMNPELHLDYYVNLLRFIKERFPIHVHGFSPPEIVFMAEIEGITIREVLIALIDAGLGSIPGGGAEILVDDVRSKVSPRKCTADQWFEVMHTAHTLRLRTTATMMFGQIETPEQRLEHLFRVRDLQDETGGFTAFIPWTFQPRNTQIKVDPLGGVAYLRMLAISRIVLDNVANLQASWVTQGAKIGQIALTFGANDLGSTMIEENVVAAAGVRFRLSQQDMVRLIRDANFTPAKRDTFYNLI